MNYSDIFEYKDGKLFRDGKEAGWSEGYRRVEIEGKAIRSHRIIYEMHHGPIPEGMVIDHINCDKMDNRVENLRAVTRRANSLNRKKHPKGAYRQGKKWVAQIRVNYENIYLGRFDTEEEAHEAYRNARIEVCRAL
jgi:hypothetical protein